MSGLRAGKYDRNSLRSLGVEHGSEGSGTTNAERQGLQLQETEAQEGFCGVENRQEVKLGKGRSSSRFPNCQYNAF